MDASLIFSKDKTDIDNSINHAQAGNRSNDPIQKCAEQKALHKVGSYAGVEIDDLGL